MSELADKVTKIVKKVDKLVKNLRDDTIELEKALEALRDFGKKKND